MKILVTGAAGFIGSAVARTLASQGHEVVGIDNINTYYDPNLKWARLAENGIKRPDNGGSTTPCKPIVSSRWPGLKFFRIDISDREALPRLFQSEKFDHVIHLAAQAGVRYSIENPWAYIDSNIVGFLNILECCRHWPVNHLVYASSSSVYGLNECVPFTEDQKVVQPVSLYAASKVADELMAHAYAKLYGLRCTGLRYFTVYGPWGRPDMAPMLFASAIMHGEPINAFNNGDMIRDFTFIDDIVAGTIMVMNHAPKANSHGVAATVYNIGCSHPVKLMNFITALESALGCKAAMNFMPMQPGDVYQTYADTTRLETEVGYRPRVRIEDGVQRFAQWYKQWDAQHQ